MTKVGIPLIPPPKLSLPLSKSVQETYSLAHYIRPEAIAAMEEIGIDITDQHSKPLSDFQAQDFDVVISLCGCGVNLPTEWVLRNVFEDWQLDDPAEQSEIFPRVRDEIKERVTQLIESLHKEVTPVR